MTHTTISAAFAIPQLLRGTARIFPLHSALLQLKYSALCSCTMNGIMKSKKKTDHLARTANNFRQEVISPAKVCGITNESETVKRLRLAVTNKDFTFKAGQWVDFFIPEVAIVGGFSICSSPGLLEQDGVLELAVKHTVHPPAHWIHTQNNIFGLMNEFPGKITCSFHVTQQSSQICEELQPYITEGRISEKELEKHVFKDTLWYICGPPPMIESISKLLENFGVPTDCIYFEKWW
ncbi:oxidoreductase NAD-binding domain-containing protein 1 isoform X3 [Gopherus evgoodei]|uniref:oxidoreductase NAD-binding domain-containing protein 1 isoform X3 n=1 Tax=Gopherus evgoodei TaxID=1825980 RepID=UPI0011D00142|nr:oxidoreductase NAD-binding domain-containing protein 1 isoform X3 [Gopherus evgoodei]